MTETTKEVFEKYEVRYSKKQKEDFRGFVNKVAVENGYECRIEQGASKSQNIIVGDVDNAKVIYTAHYDTPAHSIIPNFLMPKHFIFSLILLSLPMFLIAWLWVDLATLACDGLFAIGCPGWACWVIYSFLTFGVVVLFSISLYFGRANKHNSNDNTSGVTTLLDIMTNLPVKDKKSVAFVFFDKEEKFLKGSSGFAKKHIEIMKKGLVVNFDCVAYGKKVLIVVKKASLGYVDAIKKSFASNEMFEVEVATKGIVYPSDHSNFRGGVGVGVFPVTKKLKLEYTKNLHTNKDNVYQEENIEFLVDCSKKLIKELNNTKVNNEEKEN